MYDRAHAELRRHQHLHERLRAEFPEADNEAIRDTLEGLSDLPETIAFVLRSHLEDLALARGLKGRIDEMQERLVRLEQRAAKKRDLARSVMEQADLRRLTEPDFTVSLRASRPPLTIIDEEAIPGDYWRPQPAKLDRQGLIAALQSGRDIPGAVLGNPPMTLSVRTK